MTALEPPLVASATSDRLLSIETPFGRPVRWAKVAMVTDAGDAHELNDDRCLVLTSHDLGDRASGPSRDFMLCLLADGATGSTFSPHAADQYGGNSPKQAGWRASQLAQAAFVEQFLVSQEVDTLDRLKDGLRAADRALTESSEGRLSTTLVAVYIAADGSACAASIGDSVLLVLPPRRRSPGDQRLKKLGYEDATSVGSGDTTLASVEETQLIETWWPKKESSGGIASSKLAPGTHLVLMSDGISDNLPADVIDRLLQRHSLERATVGLPAHTRARRAEMQKRGGGSTQQLGLDNMSAIVIRYEGGRAAGAGPASAGEAGVMLTLLGTEGSPSRGGGQFGLVCLADQTAAANVVPAFARAFLASADTLTLDAQMEQALLASGAVEAGSRFAARAQNDAGDRSLVTTGGQAPPEVRVTTQRVGVARETPLQRFLYTPAIWGTSLAALAVFLLVSTAFATGTIRPAPPHPSAPRPGEPTPTPDTRPALSIGGFVLQPPAAPPPARVAPPKDAGVSQPEEVVAATVNEAEPPQPPSDAESEPPSAPPPACSNFLGFGCAPPPPPPPRRPAPARPVEPPPVMPVAVPSPAAGAEQHIADIRPAHAGPPHGSALEAALQGASAADDHFAREVDPRVQGRP